MFVYSSYHLNISFPSSGSHFNKLERVLETPKNGFVSTVTLWITLNKTNSKTRLFVLYSQNYAARALPILFNTPKKSLLKSSYPKKYLPNFRTQKNPGIENFKPKKILRSSLSLEIPSTPPPPGWATARPLSVGAESCSLKYFSDTKFVYRKIVEPLVVASTNIVTHLLQEFAFRQNLRALIIVNLWSVSHVYCTSWET